MEDYWPHDVTNDRDICPKKVRSSQDSYLCPETCSGPVEQIVETPVRTIGSKLLPGLIAPTAIRYQCPQDLHPDFR